MWGSLPPRFPVWLTAVSTDSQSSHFKGDRKKKQGGQTCTCTTCTCFWWCHRLGKKLVQQQVSGVTQLLCKLEWSTVLQECRGRSFKAVHFPFDPPRQSYTDSNTQRLYVGCHIYTGRSVFWLNTRADSSNELSLTPQVCFIPPPWLTHHCATATMLLMEKTKALGFIFLP